MIGPYAFNLIIIIIMIMALKMALKHISIGILGPFNFGIYRII